MSNPETYRRSRNLSQEQFASELGGLSKGYISRLETGRQAWPLRLALKVEDLSNGAVAALDIVEADDARLLTNFAERAIARSAATSAGGRA